MLLAANMSNSNIKGILMNSPYNLLSLLGEEIDSIITDCKQALSNTYKLCRKLNQSIQRNICEKNYDKLTQAIKEFIKNYPMCNIAQKAATTVKKIIPYCDSKLRTMLYDYEMCRFGDNDP